jgi:hypothetical protein
MTIIWFSVRFRALALLGVAAVSVTAAHAQTGDVPISNASCADVKPPAPNPQDAYGNVQLYLVPSGAPQHQSVCQATEALAAGMVDMSLGDDSVLADALGDSVPETDTGEVSEFPYLAPGSTPTPGLPPPGPAPERTEGSHVYAAFIEPKTGVEYTYSSVADSLADMKTAVAEWIASTVQPLLEQDASNAPAPANVMAHAASNARLAVAPDVEIGTPGYSKQAWTLLVEARVDMPNNDFASSVIQEFGQKFSRYLGESGENIRVYRLNGEKLGNDYFLVDTTYTQRPVYLPFDFYFPFRADVWAWANRQTDLTLAVNDANHTGINSSLIEPALYDFAPRTTITGITETFTVGGNLTGAVGAGSGGGINASYSVTRTQDSVVTAVLGSLGRNTLKWTDVYNGFGQRTATGGLVTPPSTSTNTFTGQRLAIFQVSRTTNDNIPAGRQAGLHLIPRLDNGVQGLVSPDNNVGGRFIYSGWDIVSLVFVPEPQFSATPTTIEVSKSKNSATKPVIVDVVAQSPNGSQKVTWQAELPSFLGTNLGAAGITGSGQFKIYATSAAVAGDSGFILLDSSPAAATDSLRNGPLQIPVSVVP